MRNSILFNGDFKYTGNNNEPYGVLWIITANQIQFYEFKLHLLLFSSCFKANRDPRIGDFKYVNIYFVSFINSTKTFVSIDYNLPAIKKILDLSVAYSWLENTLIDIHSDLNEWFARYKVNQNKSLQLIFCFIYISKP